jgi:predicted dehydrogenase
MAIIANPNRFHLEYAQVLAENGIDIFIEKPVGVDINEALKLKKIVEQKNVICQIGYQQRYNPCIMRVKEIVKRGMLGKILFAEAYVGERISKMHRYEDYHQMIEARQDLGGGVVLCQCHEIDHIYSIFGMPQKIYSVGGNRGDLGIGVETIMDSFLVYDAFEVRLHQDFIQYPTKKYIEIIGEKGKLSVDIVDGSLKLYGYENETEQEERFDGFERNSMFRKEIYDFISAHNAHDMTACNLEQGIGNLKIIEGIKLSAKEKREVWL